MTIQLPDDLLNRLVEAARQREMTPEQMLRDWLDRVEGQTDHYDPKDNPLLKMAEAAEAAGFESKRDDVSEKADELLRKGWADHITRKQDDNDKSCAG